MGLAVEAKGRYLACISEGCGRKLKKLPGYKAECYLVYIKFTSLLP